jgi:hypothetical protein
MTIQLLKTICLMQKMRHFIIKEKTITIPSSDYKINKKGNDEEEIIEKEPPTLSELQARNPDAELVKKELVYGKGEPEVVTNKRSEVFFRYQVLQLMYPNAKSIIPEFTKYSDPDVMEQRYIEISKQLSLSSNVENWKRYMIIGIMGIEIIMGKLLFDIEGFAQYQLVQMNTYDSLLVELAEKSYTLNGMSKWPVEIRLLGLLLVNMAAFILCKLIEKKTGINLLSTISGLTKSEKSIRPPE